MDLPDETSTIKDIKTYLKSINAAHTFKTKADYLERIDMFKSHYTFPWREDQENVIQKYFKEKSKYLVVNGIFGCGKTTLLMSLVIRSIIESIYKPDEIMFISFNVCIRDELKSKLRKYGFKSRIAVRTFDSIIFEICKNNDYPHMDLPNYDGKRRFVYDLCRKDQRKSLKFQPKVIFIDEVQDLEKQTLKVFQTFYPETRIVFAGDVFQSIQKEPRESLLWYLLHTDQVEINKFYMRETPRVPQRILTLLQKTLTNYYPEFQEEISQWKSSNHTSTETVSWNRFYSYSQLFGVAKNFVETHGKENVMILTFSSAITVKGAMGDVARIRRNLLGEGIEINRNHKKILDEKVFLSTANSSKGLERDYVLALLTFPLERAFSNFSDDLVMNLITVAMTRAKKKVVFYVPAYQDKFSRVLSYFEESPKPDKEQIREGKQLKDFVFQDYIDMELCVTELIRQSIISYDTRIEIKEMIKPYETERLFKEQISAKRPIMETDEEKSLVGIIIENLITSTWSGKWPEIEDIQVLKNHPLYCHVYKRIEAGYLRYRKYITLHKISNTNEHFKGIYMYSQLHVAIYNKLFINFGEEIVSNMKRYWSALKEKVKFIKPEASKLFIQSNLRMPWVTGVADAIFSKKYEEGDELNLWEIKASIAPDWKDNALTQVFLYALMTGKSWSRLSLINPFRNERCYYHFNSRKVMTLRDKVLKDVLTWNFNCYLAKHYNKRGKVVLDTDNKLFVSKRSDKDGICQISILEFLSPTKMFVKENTYFKRDHPKTPIHEKDEVKLDKCQKLCRESEVVWEENYLEKYKTYQIWDLDKEFKELIPEDINLQEHFDYIKNPELRYQLDFKDSLVKLFCNMVVLSQRFKLL